MKKIGLDLGHNCPPDTGAPGLVQEDTLIRLVSNFLIPRLKESGIDVINCTPAKASSVGDSLRRRCAIAEKHDVDLFVSLHFNAFDKQANGSEVFAISAKKRAAAVLEEIVNLGYRNRGVKDGSHLFVIKNTSMPAILIEGCFCDSKTDMDLFNADAMATAILKGLKK